METSMSSVPKTRKPREKAAPTFSVEWVGNDHDAIRIKGTMYVVTYGEDAQAGIILEKHGSPTTTYLVHREADGVLCCDCPDHQARWRGIVGGACKHIKAMQVVKLLTESDPADWPEWTDTAYSVLD